MLQSNHRVSYPSPPKGTLRVYPIKGNVSEPVCSTLIQRHFSDSIRKNRYSEVKILSLAHVFQSHDIMLILLQSSFSCFSKINDMIY